MPQGSSTVDGTVPQQDSGYASALIRNNFGAAANDINNVIGDFAGVVPPTNPILFCRWMDTSATPYTLNVWDGVEWVTNATLNVATHSWSPLLGASHVLTGVNYTANGSETSITATAAGLVITVPPNLVASRATALRVRARYTGAGITEISDGTNVVDTIASSAKANATTPASYQINGWRDIWTVDGTSLYSEGVG